MKNKFNYLLTLILLALGLGVSSQAWAYTWDAGVTLYFDNTGTGTYSSMVNPRVRLGNTNYSMSYTMTKVPGTANCYSYTRENKYDNAGAFVVSNNSGWTGTDKTIFQPYKKDDSYEPKDQYQITCQLNYYKDNLNVDKIFIPTNHNNKEYDCDYYDYDVRTSGWTITISTPKGGTIKVEKYNNDEGTNLTEIADGAKVLPTQYIKATVLTQPEQHYTITKISIGGSEVSIGGKYAVRGNVTVQPVYTEIPYQVTLTGFTEAKTNAYYETTGSATLKVPAGKEYNNYTATGGVNTVAKDGNTFTFKATAAGTLTANYVYKTPQIDCDNATYQIGGAAIKLNPTYTDVADDATYAWTCTSVTPTGESGATVSDCKFSATDIANPNVSATKAGEYTIQITVSQGGKSDSETITLTVNTAADKCATCFTQTGSTK